MMIRRLFTRGVGVAATTVLALSGCSLGQGADSADNADASATAARYTAQSAPNNSAPSNEDSAGADSSRSESTKAGGFGASDDAGSAVDAGDKGASGESARRSGPAAAGTTCGSVTNSKGRTSPVIVNRGSVDCEEALSLARAYQSGIDAGKAEGQGLYLTVKGWSCSWPYLPDRVHADSYLECRDPSQANSFQIGT